MENSRSNVVEHIKHIYAEGELEEILTCRKFRQVRKEGKREVAREIPYYNLDMIISLGYRVKSMIATRFRRWATERLKEYLSGDELKILNNLVSGYFDLSEINAIEHRPMYMKDYVEQLDSVLVSGNRKLLTGPGKVSHEQAMSKAKEEYKKYQKITISPVEEAYMETIKDIGKNAKAGVRKQ